MPGVRREGVVVRNFPVEGELWEKAKAKAKTEGRSVASVLQEALREYVDEGSSPE
jgi:hypothetical protein